jgi:serine phosphatase RsbU (regulator of sigma subunit)
MPFTSPPPTGRLLGFDFHWRECPCFGETVSGDGLFLEVSRADGQSLLLLVDVMGHGAAAELVVTHLRDKLLTQPGCWGLSPGQLLTVLNNWLAPVWEEWSTFVAAQAFLPTPTSDLVGSTAGIPDPLRRTAGPSSAPWDISGGIFLGPVDGSIYAEDVLSLQPGEGLLACTDGVREAARQECEGWVPLLGEGAANPADATPGPADELIRRAEADGACQQLARLREEVTRWALAS